MTTRRPSLGLAATRTMVAAAAVPSVAADPPWEPRFTIRPAAVVESSGLAVSRSLDLVYTVNDSGARLHIYALDRRSGARRGRATVSGVDPKDVEALAPGPGRQLYVGDIGDNEATRDHVTVYAVPEPRPESRTVAADAWRLRYPGGPRDAEALLVHPRTSRLLVVTKEFAGEVFAAPPDPAPHSVTRLRRVGSVPGSPLAVSSALVTDGAFLPGGNRVVLRSYLDGVLLAYPGFRRLDRVDLPSQPQGESLAVAPGGGHLLVGSEGPHSTVWQVPLPAEPAASGSDRPAGAAAPSASPSTVGPTATPPTVAPVGSSSQPAGGLPWWLTAAVVAVAAVAAIAAFPASRPRPAHRGEPAKHEH